MSHLALLFVGAVLLINGLVFLGRVDARSAVPVNLLTGSLLLLTALLQVAALSGTEEDGHLLVFGAAGFALFGFTYLTVGGNALAGGSGAALSWYCGWAACVAGVLAVINVLGAEDPRMAWLWGAWAVLFLSFFLAGVVPAPGLVAGAGILAVLQSITTATIPALLMAGEVWAEVPVAAVAVTQLLGIAIYAGCAVHAWRQMDRPEVQSVVAAGK